MIKRFLSNASGTTAIEYSLIAALVSVAIIGALTTMGARLNAMFFGPLLRGFG